MQRRRSTTSPARPSCTPIGGFIALAGAIALGPRLGRKFKRDGGGMPPGHDMTIAAVGGVILWFGWYGFNPGSTLSAMDFGGIGRVAANTTLAACARRSVGACSSSTPSTQGGTCGMTVNGFLAGLVAITCPCYWVSPFGAICIGAIAGVVVVLGDRPARVRCGSTTRSARWPVHGVCGIWGTLSLGLFATGQYGAADADRRRQLGRRVKGLFYGGGTSQLTHRQPDRRRPPSAWPRCVHIVHGRPPRLEGRRAEGLDCTNTGGSAYPEPEQLVGHLCARHWPRRRAPRSWLRRPGAL